MVLLLRVGFKVIVATVLVLYCFIPRKWLKIGTDSIRPSQKWLYDTFEFWFMVDKTYQNIY